MPNKLTQYCIATGCRYLARYIVQHSVNTGTVFNGMDTWTVVRTSVQPVYCKRCADDVVQYNKSRVAFTEAAKQEQIRRSLMKDADDADLEELEAAADIYDRIIAGLNEKDR